jgi:tetratricopeptide (TPR) repeat protein
VAAIERDLRGQAGFQWTTWNAAALYALGEKLPEPALRWAEQAVSAPFIGQENFTTLSTLAQAQVLAGQDRDGEETLERAMAHPTADPIQIHQLGRLMLSMDRKEAAMKVFERNATLHPETWPVNVGLMRGHSALGHFDEAIVYAEKALANAPDDLNRQNLERLIERLKQGQDVN